MAYENINVRMTRTGKSITWGFSLRQNGPGITVAYVEKDSMADKAGIQTGDTVEKIFGLKPGNLQEVQNRIQNADELTLVLKRFIANPPELPWTLEENGNQVVVNKFDEKGKFSGIYDKNTAGYQNSFQTSQFYGPPVIQETRKTTNYKKTETHEGGPIVPLEQLPYSNTISSESHSNWDRDEGNIKKHYESNRTYTRTESTNVAPGFQSSGGPFTGQSVFNSTSGGPFTGQSVFNSTSGGPFTGQSVFNSTSGGPFTRQSAFNSTSGAPFETTRQVTTYSNGTSAPWTTLQKTNSTWQSGPTGNGAHWNRNEHRQGGNQSNFNNYQYNQSGFNGQTGPNNQSGPGGFRSSSVLQQPSSDNNQYSPRYQRSAKSVTPVNQYDGPRMYYQRTPRTARELSPRATIQHLQYNSPLAMYSPEAAAEAYKMQTGQEIPIDGDYPTGGRPPYLDSATRRLIAEEEQGGMRYRSPTPQQSGSFKRISYAVGTPVN